MFRCWVEKRKRIVKVLLLRVVVNQVVKLLDKLKRQSCMLDNGKFASCFARVVSSCACGVVVRGEQRKGEKLTLPPNVYVQQLERLKNQQHLQLH